MFFKNGNKLLYFVITNKSISVKQNYFDNDDFIISKDGSQIINTNGADYDFYSRNQSDFVKSSNKIEQITHLKSENSE